MTGLFVFCIPFVEFGGQNHRCIAALLKGHRLPIPGIPLHRGWQSGFTFDDRYAPEHSGDSAEVHMTFANRRRTAQITEAQRVIDIPILVIIRAVVCLNSEFIDIVGLHGMQHTVTSCLGANRQAD
jgi:hypothetical protein